MKVIFKTGDEVYDAFYKPNIFGKVVNCLSNGRIEVQWLDNSISIYTWDGQLISGSLPTLSFTKYVIKREGFSQKRLLPDIKKDQPIFVRFSDTSKWKLRYFSHFEEDKIFCFHNQLKSTDFENGAEITEPWNCYSIEIPIK